MATQDAYSYENARFTVRVGSLVLPCIKIEGLATKLETETAKELGSHAIAARSEGELKPEEGKITLLLHRWTSWLGLLPANGFGLVQFTTEITFTHPRLPDYVKTANGCRITGTNPGSMEKGLAMMEVSFVYDELLENGKTVHVRAGATAAPGGVTASAAISGVAGIGF